MKITNFEPRLAIKKMTHFFIFYGFHELKIWFDYTFKGYTLKSSTKYEKNVALKPSFIVIFKSIGWIIKNYSYIHKKQKLVNSSRVISTKELQEMKILSDTQQ
jgi:hypothetical protein